MSAFRVVLLCCVVAQAAFAQLSWRNVAPVGSPPARQQHGMAFDAARGEVLLFGGRAQGGLLDDIWVWNGTAWVQRSPAARPSARLDHAMAYDLTRGEIVLFGGSNTFGGGGLNDTWVWNGSTWTQKSPATIPPSRYGHSMAYDATRGRVILYGGGTFAGWLGDTWEWDGSNWALLPVTASPPNMVYHRMAYDAARGEIVLFGGSRDVSIFGTTWALRNTPTGTAWIPLTPSASPSARYAHSMSFDAARSEIVLFGGAGLGNPYVETWTWNGTTWTQRIPTTSPSGRSNHQTAFDAQHGQTVLFGGDFFTSDTWVWPGDATGTITVTTNHPSATFTITGPGSVSYQGNGTNYTINNAPIGTYSIAFNPINGYTTPTVPQQILTSGGSITFNGNYQQLSPGTISITCNHPYGTYTISPPLPQGITSGQCYNQPPFNNVPGGSYTITFNPPSTGGYATPAATAAVIDGNTRTILGLYTLIPGSMTDTDRDGLPDDWEVNGLNGNALPLHRMGAHPFRKDVFVEVDWLVEYSTNGAIAHTHRPRTAALQKVINAFREGPVLNPDGSIGIVLHIDVGSTSTMNPLTGETWGALSQANPITETADLKVLLSRSGDKYEWQEFKTLAGATNSLGVRNFTALREQVFHYAIAAHAIPEAGGISMNEDENFAEGAQAFIIVTSPTDSLISEAVNFMHELGHNLGLSHGGIVDGSNNHTNGKPNYLSIMNYNFSKSGVPATGATGSLDWLVDYSRVVVSDLDEDRLEESAGLGAQAQDTARSVIYGTRLPCTSTANLYWDARSNLNFNCNDMIDQALVGACLHDYSLVCVRGLLKSPAMDWGALVFKGGAVGDANTLGGVTNGPNSTRAIEPTPAKLQEITRNDPKPCRGDANGDRIVDSRDLAIVQIAFGSFNGGPRYDDRADVYADGVVNVMDLAIISRDLGCRTQ